MAFDRNAFRYSLLIPLMAFISPSSRTRPPVVPSKNLVSSKFVAVLKNSSQVAIHFTAAVFLMHVGPITIGIMST